LIAALSLNVNAQDMKVKTKSSLPDKLPPIPAVPAPLGYDTIPLGDWKTFPEMKLDLPVTKGPFEPAWESIEKNYPGEPCVFRKYKFLIINILIIHN